MIDWLRGDPCGDPWIDGSILVLNSLVIASWICLAGLLVVWGVTSL